MIRPAEYRDIPALVELVMEFFEDSPTVDMGMPADPDTIEFFLQDCIDLDDKTVLVADVDGEIIGGIGGGVSPWIWNANITALIELGWFVPLASRERHPLEGMRLKRVFYQWGRDNGATHLIMVSTKREESPRVIKFYEKSGLVCADNNYLGRL
jgi:hypothetical protein